MTWYYYKRIGGRTGGGFAAARPSPYLIKEVVIPNETQ
jgi:hypothetical protein